MNRLTKKAKNGLAYVEIPMNYGAIIDKHENLVWCHSGTIDRR
jgi:hypothetical protein